MNADRWRQVDTLYHATLERDPEERSAFLANACTGDEELRHEVESLLAQENSSEGLLDRPAADLLSDSTHIRRHTGALLGPYRIEGPLGIGGMGEVFRAMDTRLGRQVAIKISNQRFSGRFEREARAIAALNHPHICALYDVGPDYLVMELVEGPTLAERIARGPIPFDEALDIARQIREALEAAHEKGVIHRDLKPANVKIKPDGVVKVLDFGLAKAAEEPGATTSATHSGMILGTAAYMSPEQASGKRVDKRTDIWAFGVVLHEMLIGQRLFKGETISDTLAAVMTKEPDWSQVPVKAQRLLRACLEKNPKHRLRDIGDATIFFDEAPQAPSAKSRVPWAVAGVLATMVAIALGSSAWRGTQPSQITPQPLLRLNVDLGPEVSLGSVAGADVAISPDGTRLAYVSQFRLFTRRLDQTKATELTGTEEAQSPFFSPDGQWIVFGVPGRLKKVPVQGGEPVVLCNITYTRGASWGDDGNIFAALNTGVLARIPSAGGPPTPITELAPGEVAHRWPQVLPGGKAVLFSAYTSGTGLDGASIQLMSLGDRRRTTLQRGTYGRYLPSGHLVYLHNGTLYAVPFDLGTLRVHGTPAPVLSEVAYDTLHGAAQIDFSRTGTLVYRIGGAERGLRTVQWMDAAGKTQPLLEKPGDYLFPKLSPDGSRLALGSLGDIWVYDWQRDTMTRLSFNRANFSPVWSRDGRHIMFQNAEAIFWIRANGAGKPQVLTQTGNYRWPWSFTPDGKRLAFYELDLESAFDLWTVPLESDDAGLRAGSPEVFLKTSFEERHPSFSPDGRWLAYVSNESGKFQVYVQPFPGKSGKWQISNGGGMFPVWSHSSHELFFRTTDNQIMVAAYTVKGDTFVTAKPHLWSENKLANVGSWGNYDVAPDGKRIVALMPAADSEGQRASNHVIFLLNFFDELRRRVPAGGN